MRPVLRRPSQIDFDCVTWAQEVMGVLSNKVTKEERSKVLEPVTNLASEMLSHLLIASMALHRWLDLYLSLICTARNLGGKKTPQETVHPTPNFQHLRAILDLLEEATTKRSQSALKELVRHFHSWAMQAARRYMLTGLLA